MDIRSLVRGALWHDYFLYDWHIPDESHKWHGVTHAGDALKKAMRDFELNEIEQDMIRKHMFPLESSPAEISGELGFCVLRIRYAPQKRRLRDVSFKIAMFI